MTRHYYGTKRIIAVPMTRAEYNAYRGWTVPADENPNDEGCLVEYTDGDRSNHPNHAGYISWSPKDVFEASYQPFTALSFGHAIEALKVGHRVARAGWNGKGMFLRLVLSIHDIPRGGTTHPVYRLTTEDEATALPWIGMKTADNKFVPWLASQTDMLANDWVVLE
ncbi:DUF2829 domain-containing protein [Microvirga sp. KLBC 81]|uniref:DUF2829 domain-containing protein n=1 Tax=Microvirga sp. KLBC 81 TaxID=1862707 RepID=UPI000D508B0D|nr:DUF2829 domain-containing protein [Microvirga sp. KLBC 81]PVE25421.1 DUF2829 domain-containing protein [Microvirga sp. KLBC 81]